VGEKQDAGTSNPASANLTDSATEPVPQLIVKSAEDGELLHKYPLAGAKAESSEDPASTRPVIHFQDQPPASSNDFVLGAVYTPNDNALYNLKITIANSTHHGLQVLSKTQVSNTNATLPRAIDHVTLARQRGQVRTMLYDGANQQFLIYPPTLKNIEIVTNFTNPEDPSKM